MAKGRCARCGAASVARGLGRGIDAQTVDLETRHFPDGEHYLRLAGPLKGADVIVLCGLEQPDQHLLPLLLLAAEAREQGAASIGLVAPYLSYMRQDKRFHAGEIVTSRHFAQLLSRHFDWLVTVDPHLHRYHALEQIYSIPCRVLHAAALLGEWLTDSNDVFLVGPDAESEQWVSAMGRHAGLPWVTASKQRLGDHSVQVTLPDLAAMAGRRPVLVDDVISSGMTMLRTLEGLAETGFSASTCLCIHGLFAENSDDLLAKAGATLVSCNTIAHASNRLDVTGLLVPAVAGLLATDR